MMKIKVAIIALLMSVNLLQCKEPDAMDNYSDEQLLQIICDVHIANAAISKSPQEAQDSLRDAYFNQLQKLHSLSKGDLEFVLENIHKNIDRYQNLATTISDSLDQQVKRMKENTRIATK